MVRPFQIPHNVGFEVRQWAAVPFKPEAVSLYLPRSVAATYLPARKACNIGGLRLQLRVIRDTSSDAKIASCPLCPESDGWPSKCRPSRWA